MTKYWIAVVSKDHIQIGVAGGFMQACHGKKAPLQRIKRGDWVIFYSPKQSMNGAQKCQAFTAIGQASDDEIFQFQQFESFVPFRRRMTYYDGAEVSILPLIPSLDFIKDKTSWGYQFRFGFLEIPHSDFLLISERMLGEVNARVQENKTLFNYLP